MNIILQGEYLEYNLGIPSLCAGFAGLYEDCTKEGANIIFYERQKIKGPIPQDINATVRYLPFGSSKQAIVRTLMYKMGFRSLPAAQLRFFEDIENADIVIDLYGICFCSQIGTKDYSRLGAKTAAISEFVIPYIAKRFFGKKTLKTAASYGPFATRNMDIKAQFASEAIFDVMYAREHASAEQLRSALKSNDTIAVTPDIAYYLPYSKTTYGEHKCIGVSVSHQIIKQWKSAETYYYCICTLLNHILATLPNHHILLIPNEVSPVIKDNDMSVAQLIANQMGDCNRLEIDNSVIDSPVRVKDVIAKCDLLVSSRYHSCVAALSAGIPTLVIGWHNKYEELLALYEQESCGISADACSAELLIKKFDEVWNDRFNRHATITSSSTRVRSQLISTYAPLFVKERDCR